MTEDLTTKPDQAIQQNAETKQQQTETRPLTNPEYLAEAKQFGDFYVKTMESLTGKGELPTPNETNESGMETQIVQSIKKHLTEQQVIVMLKHMTTQDILTQAFSTDEQQAILANNPDAYRLEEPQPGMYTIFMNTDLVKTLGGENTHQTNKTDQTNKLVGENAGQARAVKVKDGVSFVLIRQYADGTTPGLDENYPHEASHIGYAFLRRDEIIQNEEVNPEKQRAFFMYQDELISHLLSDGSMLSYSHLNTIPIAERAKLEKEQPALVQEIRQTVIDANNLLQTIDTIRQLTDVRKQDFILPVFQARSFTQLQEGLTRMQDIVDEQPKKEPEPFAGGWGFN